MYFISARKLSVGLLGVALHGCFVMRPSRGGGQTDVELPRQIDTADIALPQGYQIEAVASELTFPTAVIFDEEDSVYIIEAGYSYGEVWTIPRLLRLEKDGTVTEIARGDEGPWTGGSYGNGFFYISQGGFPGKILRISKKGGEKQVLVDNLPSYGDHHTNRAVLGPDGYVYFGQGTVTNSGVVGTDNADFGWLKRHPRLHDIACKDIMLAGENFTSGNPLTDDKNDSAVTGAFLPFGTPSKPGQVVNGQIPCSGAILRVPARGGPVELVAWGMRNPFGLAFAPGGKLYVTENGFDDRGSRPIHGGGDYLWEIDLQMTGQWYGWPDFAGAVPLISGGFQPPGKKKPKYLLQKHPNPPPKTVAELAVHSSANGFDFSRNESFGHVGEAFIALFGDMAPNVGKVLSPVGFKIVRVSLKDGIVHEFAANQGKTVGPASWIGNEGIERPVDVKFNGAGTTLYMVDFGVLKMAKGKTIPYQKTGVVWRITHAPEKNMASQKAE